MSIYLIQHGEAKTEEEDPARGLTDKGFRDAGRVAAYVAKLPVKPHRIFHSGKARAEQTASIFQDALGPSGRIAETDGLAPMDDPMIWADRLSLQEGPLVLVGHLPHLSRLASILVAGDRDRPVVEFKMGGVVSMVRVEPGRWLVEWILIPDIII